jgi:cell division protein FtsI/penicillin-binding protein 2
MATTVPAKAHRALSVIFLSLVLIFLRVGFLAVAKQDDKRREAYAPQRRLILEPAPRATITDRFGLPLAMNQTLYSLAVTYAPIRQLPAFEWIKGKGKQPFRSRYIASLAQLLTSELGLDPVEVEDLIHARASVFPSTPFVLKEGLSEEQYYRLRALERDWPGLKAQRKSQRFYPRGKVACDLLGYLGPISEKKYLQIAAEIGELEAYIASREAGEYPPLPKGFSSPLDVRERLKQLKERAYTIHDLVGKSGVEAFYEEELRGFAGRRTVEVDVKGKILRELPGSRDAIGGKHLTLTISAELQEFAEELLASIEGASSSPPLARKWIRGGGIVAMIPATGEVVALASYPRFDPNDFIPAKDPDERQRKNRATKRWLEGLSYIGDLWDGKAFLEKESFSFLKGTFVTEETPLSWPLVMDALFPASGPLRQAANRLATLGDALELQQEPMRASSILEEDRQLLFDLCQTVAPASLFSEELRRLVGSTRLEHYHTLRQTAMRLHDKIRTELQQAYHHRDFTAWRTEHFKEFLQRKRRAEKEAHRYPRPYTDYLNEAESHLFQAFWQNYRAVFLYTVLTGGVPITVVDYPQLEPYFSLIQKIHLQQDDPSLPRLQQTILSLGPRLGLEYLNTMRSFDDLTQPLAGSYPRLRAKSGKQLGKHLIAAAYPHTGYGYGRSEAFRKTSAQGSVFKVVTAYQALFGRWSDHLDLNPFRVIDDFKGDPKSSSPHQILGYFPGGTPIVRSYKGGRLPRSSHPHIGQVDLLGALEQSSNLYFAMLAGDYIGDPSAWVETARSFGFGDKTGIDLPGEVTGSLPDDLLHNRTGLYSFAIGQHSLTTTPLQTAVMMAAFANRGAVVQPRVVRSLKGEKPVREGIQLFDLPAYPFQNPLALVGIDFPLFTATLRDLQETEQVQNTARTVRKIPFPTPISRLLFEGMERVVTGPKGTARPSIMRSLYDHPSALHDYRLIAPDLIGKTGTAQVRYKASLDRETPAEMEQNIWFAAISYPPELRLSKERFDHPELVVVVFLRFGEAGKDAAPIAAQIVRRWREIQKP